MSSDPPRPGPARSRLPAAGRPDDRRHREPARDLDPTRLPDPRDDGPASGTRLDGQGAGNRDRHPRPASTTTSSSCSSATSSGPSSAGSFPASSRPGTASWPSRSSSTAGSWPATRRPQRQVLHDTLVTVFDTARNEDRGGHPQRRHRHRRGRPGRAARRPVAWHRPALPRPGRRAARAHQSARGRVRRGARSRRRGVRGRVRGLPDAEARRGRRRRRERVTQSPQRWSER